MEDLTNLHSVMNYVSEQKELLWTAWTECYSDFESTIRLAIQKVEGVKLEYPKLTTDISYHLGKMEGYIEFFEQMFRLKNRIASITDCYCVKTAVGVKILESLQQNSRVKHTDLAEAVGISYDTLTDIMKEFILSGAVDYIGSGQDTRYRLTDDGKQYCMMKGVGGNYEA